MKADPSQSNSIELAPSTRRRSLRWRLQIWHTAILMFVLAIFGSLIYFQLRVTVFTVVDADLLSGGRVLENRLLEAMKPFGPPTFELGNQRRGPPGPRGFGRMEMPVDPERENYLRNVDKSQFQLPGSVKFHRRPADPLPWFGIFLRDGTQIAGSVEKALSMPDPPRGPWDFRRSGYNREMIMRGPEGTLILVGKEAVPEVELLQRLLAVTIGGAVLMTILGFAGGWWLTGKAIQPLAHIAETAESISATQLSNRIHCQAMDAELARLGEILNSMLARLEQSFEQQAQFTADASHELRTPLAVLISQIEVALQRTRSPEEYQRALRNCWSTSQKMKQQVENLLTLAKADAGQLGAVRERVDLSLVIDEALEYLEPLIDSHQAKITKRVLTAECQGDPIQLLQVAVNLIQNAIVHNPPGSIIQVSTSQNETDCQLMVSDNGPGIPAEHLPRLFDRFYRVDAARRSEFGSNGLGLSICQSIAKAHRGQVTVSSSNQGTEFVLSLPRVENQNTKEP